MQMCRDNCVCLDIVPLCKHSAFILLYKNLVTRVRVRWLLLLAGITMEASDFSIPSQARDLTVTVRALRMYWPFTDCIFSSLQGARDVIFFQHPYILISLCHAFPGTKPGFD